MKFPIAIEPATQRSAWGVVVPDLPGCFSAGDTAEKAFANAAEAIQAHCEMLAQGQSRHSFAKAARRVAKQT